ncbi:uncharacterized protein LOC125177710 [Hyalella azteca]|uniref:Uncharacterized protein LOC125177710 n=1 Tax=Hyalella azteca TaxID=294128 RepID=A0A979FH45_HYAAZ|nr:uncharacterized protein LOC125177710 [Hyalella azteca]
MLNLRKDTSAMKPAEPKDKVSDAKPVRTLSDERSVLVNSAAGVSSKSCEFCGAANHSMLKCSKYPSPASRISRCKELGLCFLCSSSKHMKPSCPSNLDYPCSFCSKKTHISALCPKFKCNSENSKETPSSNVNWCLNSSQQGRSSHLLPTITLTVSRGYKKTKVRFLIDTCSQKSYVTNRVLDKLGVPQDRTKKDFVINTFLQSGVRQFSEISLLFDLEEAGGRVQLPILVSDEFRLTFAMRGLGLVTENISRIAPLADSSFTNCSDTVELEGLIGIDVLQFLKDFHVVLCLRGSVFSLAGKLIPFGDVENFLTSSQITSLSKVSSAVSDHSVSSSLVNFVLDPVCTCRDPIASIAKDSEIEGHLDNLFKLDSIGIKETNNEIANSDASHLDNFEKSLVLEDGKYFVEIPWWSDKIADVKPNFEVAKAVLGRVIERLDKTGMRDAYGSSLTS